MKASPLKVKVSPTSTVSPPFRVSRPDRVGLAINPMVSVELAPASVVDMLVPAVKTLSPLSEPLRLRVR